MAIVQISLALGDLGASLHSAATTRATAMPELARLAADTALATALEHDPATTFARVDVGAVEVTLTRDRGLYHLRSVVAGQDTFAFRCSEVPGAAPDAFRYPGTAVDPPGGDLVVGLRRVAADQLPCLDAAEVSLAPRADQLPAFRQDGGVALLTWESGTDRPDFVFEPRRAADLDAAGGLVVVCGNLWVEVGSRPLRLALQRDLVVVVRGNLYLGRSIQVDGPGRLVLVASRSRGEPVFADRDGNGRWSPGDVLRGADAFTGPSEGAGNVYLGLPESTAAIRCDAGLVVGGEAHVAAPTRVGGPLVLAHGVTQLKPGGLPLQAAGDWVFAVERERVPGFVTTGRPRPGLLAREVASDPRRHEPLYLAAPAR
ncbi:MAG: hypothetical protein KF830_02715 [Planctomycetes bacterium]|nr:hypothetical protein [Planctomycetota bacterium]